MKATGIIRRIDNLGRIVIPKEIRRSLQIKDGAYLEFFANESGEIVLKKYSPLEPFSEFAMDFAGAMAAATMELVIITDCEKLLAVAGNGRKDFSMGKISMQLGEAIEGRKLIFIKPGQQPIPVLLGERAEYSSQIISPIVSEGDAIGSIIILGRKDNTAFGEGEIRMAKMASLFFGRQLEALALLAS